MRTTVLVIDNHDMIVFRSNNKGFLHTRQFSCLLTRIVAIGMPQFTLKSRNYLKSSVSSLLISGNRSRKLAISTTDNLSSLSGFSHHTNLLMTEANDYKLTNLTPTKLIT